jgi:LPS export ABC transporter permease LptG/LPS export ABC transporter permease LptF
MRILSRYVFREIVSSAVLGTVLATFVIFLQGVDRLFELLVRGPSHTQTVLWLFALALPPVLPLALPFGVLVGILIGLGRMSTDGEITAMRAGGVSSRAVIPPVLTFALLATLVTAAASLWLTPLAIRQSVNILNRLMAEQLSADIQPRVFDEQFPNTILYVGDVKPGPVALWRNVFLADLTPPEQRTIGFRDKGQGNRITVAAEAIALPDPAQNRIQLSLKNASTHEVDKDGVADDSAYTSGEQVLEASQPSEVHYPFREMKTGELKRYSRTGKDWIEARIELHRRMAFPFACLTLALVGIPLGVSSRKGGKSAAYVTALFLAFFCYYFAFMAIIGLAKQRAVPVEAIWTPNAAFLVAGLILIARLERPVDRDLLGTLRGWITAGLGRLRPQLAAPAVAQEAKPRRAPWLPLVPQLIDTYVLNSFLFWFAVLMASFVMMAEVYNFFDLLSDIIHNGIAMSRVVTYLFFLAPLLIYKMLPISVLVAVLVTFGVLTKHNEVTAFKACGVSLHRLAIPVMALSMMLSVGLFAFDHFYLPDANRKQDALRNEIKGKPVQTYLNPERKWIYGAGSHIYYYKYFDNGNNLMAGVSVYELDPKTFDLKREISAERAQWQPALHTWIFQSGWVREIHGKFESFQVKTFPHLEEPPDYFLKKLEQGKEMNFQELQAYITDLQQSGFDTVRLRVQLHEKFSVPLFALIMAMISVPFAFLVGNRGALAGIGVSIGIAMAYWGIGKLFEQVGNANQLPPSVAAWSPDLLFALAGGYLLLRMRS